MNIDLIGLTALLQIKQNIPACLFPLSFTLMLLQLSVVDLTLDKTSN